MRILLITLLSFVFQFVLCEAGSGKGIKNQILLTRADSLNTVAANELNVNLSQALIHATFAKELSVEIDYPEGILESVIIQCYVWANTNKCTYALLTLDSPDILKLRTAHSVIGGKYFSVKAECFYYLGEYDSSKYYYSKAIDMFNELNVPGQIIIQYNKLSKILLQTGNTRQAGVYNEKAFEIADQSKNELGKAQSQDMLGEILQAQRLYEKALAAHQHSSVFFEKLNHRAGMAAAFLHIGNSHYMLIHDDSAKAYYQKALLCFQKLGDSTGIAISYSNLSRVALEWGKFEEALQFAFKSLSVIQDGGYKRIETSTLQQIGDIYSEMKNYNEAVLYVNKALSMADEAGDKVKIMDCYKSLSEIHAAINKYSRSYEYLLRAYRLKDSIQPIAFSQQLAEMQDTYESKQQEAQIQLLEQSSKIKTLEISEQQNQIGKRNFIIILSLLIFIMIATAVYFSIQKQKLKSAIDKEQAIKITEESERIRFAKDIHDDLGSGLSKISFLSEIIVRQNTPQQEAKQTASAISDTAKGLIDNMRDLIWALNPENSTFNTLLADIREYASDYLEDFPAELIIKFPDAIDSRNISRECHREIMMTIKESLNNIVKHASAGVIVIKADINNSEFWIAVSDNGSGITAEHFSNGHGMKNMKSRMVATGGVFEFESSPVSGTTIMVKIPIEKMLVS